MGLQLKLEPRCFSTQARSAGGKKKVQKITRGTYTVDVCDTIAVAQGETSSLAREGPKANFKIGFALVVSRYFTLSVYVDDRFDAEHPERQQVGSMTVILAPGCIKEQQTRAGLFISILHGYIAQGGGLAAI